MMKNIIAERMDKLTPSGIRKVNEKALQLEREGKRVYHFELGRPDFDTPKYIKDACIKSINEGRVFYTSNYGTDELRKEIARKLKKHNNIDCDYNNILVTAGLAEAILDIMLTILNPGDEVLIPDPGWLNYLNIPEVLDAKAIQYSLLAKNDYQIDFEELKSKISSRTKAIVIINPNNPIGSVLDEDCLMKLSEVAKEKDLFVISDEIYERITYDNFKHKSIASFDGMLERTITLNGFSKAYSMTGWRLGYIAGPEYLIKQINKIHQHNTACATSFVQDAGVVALSDEKDEVNKMVKEYEKRRNYLVDRINKIKELELIKPKGAFYCFINISKTGMKCEEFCDFLLEEANVAVVPGNVFGKNGEEYIRLSYAASLDDIKQGLQNIENCLEKIGLKD
ncbi:pyridoxal phosphate-dependent aminotransferase [Peptoniphilus grossensis]|uniref:pyridoxal phosphate-dependent aminotransferase n=1 Tax=Peptoniphilus grossensis TaxID=1465756 RepID=UPI0040679241